MRVMHWGALAVLLLSLSGCQLGRPSEEPAAVSVSPKSGGTLNLLTRNDPTNWDPTTQSVVRGIEYTYSRLLSYKVGPDLAFTDAVLEPELAESWEIAPNAQTFTFHLRKGVKFAAIPPVNGREVVAADVKFSLEYAARLGDFKAAGISVVKDYTQGLARVDAPDPYTAVVRFNEPSIPFLNYAAAEYMPVFANEVYKADGHFKDTVVGSGPFQLDRAGSQKGTRWVWKKNPTYWENGKPYVDEVRFLVIPEDSTRNAAFQTKQLDAIGFDTAIPYPEAQQIRAANPSAVMNEYEPYMLGFFYMNTRVKPLDDIRIRRAIALAIDNDEFMRTLQGGRGSRLVPAVFNGYFTQEEVKRLLPYDLEKAKQLVAEAHPGGVSLEMPFAQSQSSWESSFLQLLQAQLKKANINVTLKPLDTAELTRYRRQPDYFLSQTIAGSLSSLKYDPDRGVARFHTTSDNNFWGISDRMLDGLIEAQRKELDAPKRRELIRQIGLRLVDQAYTLGFFTAVEYTFSQPYVKGLYRGINAPPLPIINVWLDK